MTEKKDVVSIILSEHRQVETLFEEYKSARKNNYEAKQKIVYEIIKELSQHAACEEAVVYPVVREKLGAELADQCIEEHQEMKNVLYELDSMKASDPQFDEKVHKLIQDVLSHVKDNEEPDLLPRLKNAVSQEQLIKMGDDFISAKSIAPTRPHPSAPAANPTLAKIANIAAKPIDAMRDKARFGNETESSASLNDDSKSSTLGSSPAKNTQSQERAKTRTSQ